MRNIHSNKSAESPQSTSAGDQIYVADEVWLAAALLHREHPEREDFTAKEIEARAERENITGRLRPGVFIHANLHCVANRPPNPGRYRMLFATGKKTRRLFRPGDLYDPKREGAKTVPDRADLPARYHELLDWYSAEYSRGRGEQRKEEDPLIGIRGQGREIWAGETPDDYVRRLRGGWS